MNQTPNKNHDGKAAGTPPERHAAKDPFAQFDHLVRELTEAEQQAIVGGWWTNAGMFVWRGGF